MQSKLAMFLKSREAELRTRIQVLSQELVPLEAELADVRRAQKAIEPPLTDEEADNEHGDEFEIVEIVEVDRYKNLSMKQLTLRALKEHFEKGATAQQLLAFFKDAYGRRDVVRSSLSPQLTRLKREKKITREGMIWKISPDKETPSNKEGVSSVTAEEQSLAGELFGETSPQTPDLDPG
jgi:hypothetical protein